MINNVLFMQAFTAKESCLTPDEDVGSTSSFWHHLGLYEFIYMAHSQQNDGHGLVFRS